MYGVWQTGRHFCEPGLQPWAVSESLSKLEEWATTRMLRADSKRFFFAETKGSLHQSTQGHWSVVGHLYKDGIKAARKDPERYVDCREGRRASWNDPKGEYPVPSQTDRQRPTINIDKES